MNDANYAMVLIGSSAGTAKDTVDFLRERGIKAGLLKIRMFRPFPAEEITKALEQVKVIACMDRTESYNTQCGPIGAEVKNALYNENIHIPVINEELIERIQQEVDRRWEDLLYRCNR